MPDVPLSCACGLVGGVVREVSSRVGCRVVCYCSDCRAFARHLGRPERDLDASGGTDLFQISPARLAFERGRERLACVRLTERGMLRWYAACCRTPIGNTMATPKLPFVGLIHTATDAAAADRDAVFGPVRYRVQGADAIGPVPDGTAPRFALGSLLRLSRILLPARLRGDAARSPFFAPATGTPIAAPHVLSEPERARLYD